MNAWIPIVCAAIGAATASAAIAATAGAAAVADAAASAAATTAAGTASAAAATSPATLATPSGVLHGTLTLPAAPAAPGAPPVLLLHPGSGPTDRDGNSVLLPGRNDSLKQLAEALAARGVATLRIDKRGVGESAAAAPAESALRFSTYVDDAAAWLRQLRASGRYCAVLAGGHSEGAQIAVRAAAAGGAQAVVLLAGAGRPAGAVLRAQLAPQLPPALYAQAERTLAALERGEVGQPVPPGLDALFRPSVQPYLASWLPLDPAADLAAWRGPAFMAWGEADAQVSAADFDALRHARPDATVLRLPATNHLLKDVSAPGAAARSMGDATVPLTPGLADALAAFARAACR